MIFVLSFNCTLLYCKDNYFFETSKNFFQVSFFKAKLSHIQRYIILSTTNNLSPVYWHAYDYFLCTFYRAFY